MSKTIKANIKDSDYVQINPGAIYDNLKSKGRLPPLSIRVQPLETGISPFFSKRFLSYKFSSSILIPVDTFDFKISLDESGSLSIPVKEGDIINLFANNIPLATGIIDAITVETDEKNGTSISITGRDLLSQFEDQDAVSLNSKIIYGSSVTVAQVISLLSENTRISKTSPILINCPKNSYLFATQPGESKMSALQRYCEPLNILFWMSGDGRITIGKPNMYQKSKGVLFLRRNDRTSNVLSMRSSRNSTQIPNMIVPIWNGQETVVERVKTEQVLYNDSSGPKRLRKLGHQVPKAVVVSTPQGSSPQDLSEVNTINVANQTKAGSSNLLQAMAKREIARANINELQVECQVVGHYNASGEPYAPDQVYTIQYDLDNINEDLYLYKVEYTFDINMSQKTNLFFCKKTAIVSDVVAI